MEKKHSSVGRKNSWVPPKAIILQYQQLKHFNSAFYLPYSNQNGCLSNGSDISANDVVVTLGLGREVNFSKLLRKMTHNENVCHTHTTPKVKVSGST